MNHIIRSLVTSSLISFVVAVFSSCDKGEYWTIDNCDAKEYDELTDFFDIELIQLEENDKAILENVQKVVCLDSFLFVLSKGAGGDALFEYSTSGRFLHKIGRRGNGRNEYLSISSFVVNDEHVEIIDGMKHRILKYSFGDSLLSITKPKSDLQFLFDAIAFNGSVIAAYDVNPMDGELYALYDEDYQCLQKMQDKRFTIDGAVSFASIPLAANRTCLSYVVPFDNSVYCMDETFASSLKYKIADIKNESVPKDEDFMDFFAENMDKTIRAILSTSTIDLLKIGSECYIINNASHAAFKVKSTKFADEIKSIPFFYNNTIAADSDSFYALCYEDVYHYFEQKAKGDSIPNSLDKQMESKLVLLRYKMKDPK